MKNKQNMDLHSLKKGDIVFLKKEVQYSFTNRQIFFVKAEIKSAGKLNITVDGKKYSRKSGVNILDNSNDKIYIKAKDQTKKYKEFLEKVELYYKINTYMKNLSVSPIMKLSDLRSIYFKIIEIREMSLAYNI